MANIDTYLTNGNNICYFHDKKIEQTGIGQSYFFEDFPSIFLWQRINISNKNLRLRGRYGDTYEEFDIGCKMSFKEFTIIISTEEANPIFQSFINGKIVWNTDRPILTIYLSFYEEAFNVAYIMHNDTLYADLVRNKLCVSRPIPPWPDDTANTYVLTVKNGLMQWLTINEVIKQGQR